MSHTVYVCTLGLMIQPPYPAAGGWFAVESPWPFAVGHPHWVIDPMHYDDVRGVFRMTGVTPYRVPVFLQPGQPCCLWFAGDLGGPAYTEPCWRPADADRSGVVNSADLSAFLSRWIGSLASGGDDPSGDINADLHVDSADVSAFVSLWLADRGGG